MTELLPLAVKLSVVALRLAAGLSSAVADLTCLGRRPDQTREASGLQGGWIGEDQKMTGIRYTLLLAALGVGLHAADLRADGPLEKAKDAVDPDCSIGKAVRGAATKAAVGVRGNRCGAGETARDTLGIDDRDRRNRDDDRDGPRRRGRDNDG